jgi:hypothetical protein
MDRTLVGQPMDGDEAAFDALIERVGDHLRSVPLRILRDAIRRASIQFGQAREESEIAEDR